MKSILLAALIIACFGTIVHAQSGLTTLEDLKLQLIDITAQQEALTEHVKQLDDALKPENIERSLAGVGSTRPEELREQRRRQLMIEKTHLTADLELVTLKRSKLEEMIANEEVRSYQQSALGSPVNNAFQSGLLQSGWLLAMLLVAGVVVLTGIGVLWSFARRNAS